MDTKRNELSKYCYSYILLIIAVICFLSFASCGGDEYIDQEPPTENNGEGDDDNNEGGEGNEGGNSNKRVVTGNADTYPFYAVLQGEIRENLGAVRVGFRYGTNPNMASNSSSIPKVLSSTPAKFRLATSKSLQDCIAENTKYYYQAYVEINGKRQYGDVCTFISECSRCPDDLTYMIDGNEYKMILVKDGPQGDFYIMQTELLPESSVRFGDVWVPRLNVNNDAAVLKSEMRTFFEELLIQTGIAFRMPTKEEWIYAARGGHMATNTTYSGSNKIDEVAWYKNNSGKRVHPIAQKKANELGLYDMSGNYAEVTNEYYDYRNGNYCNTDGYICGGSWESQSYDCEATSVKRGLDNSNKIPGTNFIEKNAFDARRNTIRLVYSRR